MQRRGESTLAASCRPTETQPSRASVCMVILVMYRKCISLCLSEDAEYPVLKVITKQIDNIVYNSRYVYLQLKA